MEVKIVIAYCSSVGKFVKSFKVKTIVHTFLESGHSFVPNDRDFSRIEIAKHKAKSLFGVGEHFESMNCRKTKL